LALILVLKKTHPMVSKFSQYTLWILKTRVLLSFLVPLFR
jgi:hypothetical protein